MRRVAVFDLFVNILRDLRPILPFNSDSARGPQVLAGV